jgi:hypothetical protein
VHRSITAGEQRNVALRRPAKRQRVHATARAAQLHARADRARRATPEINVEDAGLETEIRSDDEPIAARPLDREDIGAAASTSKVTPLSRQRSRSLSSTHIAGARTRYVDHISPGAASMMTPRDVAHAVDGPHRPSYGRHQR